jgi:hypothetical protein
MPQENSFGRPLALSFWVSYMLAITGGFVDIAIKMKRHARGYFAPLLSLAMLSAVGTAASGQTTQPMQPAPPTSYPTNPTPVGPTPRPAPPDDITRREVADMNNFLDSHPEVAEQLRKDPSLIDNHRWVADHPALQDYLHTHPNVAEAFHTDPNLFMRDEDRYGRQDGGNGITRREVTDMGRFLDSHPEVAEQLRKDPSLIDNRQWVSEHPALQEYLKTHPDVSDEFRSNPVAFMRDEDRYQHQQGDHDQMGAGNRDEHNRGELTNFGQFLGGHSNVAAELSNDPSLANNKEYRASHPELTDYLNAHPTVSQQLAADPQAVMSSNWVQQGGFSAKPVGPTSKPKTSSTPNQ